VAVEGRHVRVGVRDVEQFEATGRDRVAQSGQDRGVPDRTGLLCRYLDEAFIGLREQVALRDASPLVERHGCYGEREAQSRVLEDCPRHRLGLLEGDGGARWIGDEVSLGVEAGDR
jgi:hypothetical protein